MTSGGIRRRVTRGPTAPRRATIETLVRVYERLGFAVCGDAHPEPRKKQGTGKSMAYGDGKYARTLFSSRRWSVCRQVSWGQAPVENVHQENRRRIGASGRFSLWRCGCRSAARKKTYQTALSR